MSKRRKRRRTSQEAIARRRFVLGLLLFLLALAAAIVWSDVARRYVTSEPAPVPLSAAEQSHPPADPLTAGAERAVYPYSVIDGGARTVEELKAAMADDPIVAAHYANFSIEKTHVERLREPRLAHVSYRIADAVYWTRKPLALRSGEVVLTDGVHVARARCGNQLADVPGEVSPLEPPAAVMDVPATPALISLLSRLPLRNLPNSLPGGLLQRPASSPGGGELLGLDPGAVPAPPLMLGSMPAAPGRSADITPEPQSPAPEDPVTPAPQPIPPNPGPSHTPVPPQAPGPSPIAGPPAAPTPPTAGSHVPPPLQPPLLPPEVLVTPGTDPQLPPVDVQPPPNLPDVPVPVPEPGTALFMIAGGIGYALRRLHPRRRGE